MWQLKISTIKFYQYHSEVSKDYEVTQGLCPILILHLFVHPDCALCVCVYIYAHYRYYIYVSIYLYETTIFPSCITFLWNKYSLQRVFCQIQHAIDLLAFTNKLRLFLLLIQPPIFDKYHIIWNDNWISCYIQHTTFP